MDRLLVLTVSVCLYVSVCISVSVSIYLSMCLSMYLCVCLSFCLPPPLSLSQADYMYEAGCTYSISICF